MNKKTIITALLALAALTGWAQSTKTATVTGYSPALKDGTLVISGAGNLMDIVDTVKAGHFTLTIPVEELTVGALFCEGDGCPNFTLSLMLRPGVTVKLTGTDCLFPLWKVESPIPEQQTLNRMTEHCRDVIMEFFQIEQSRDRVKSDSINMVLMKTEMDILASLPVDAASISKLTNIARMLKNIRDFPYIEQLKDLEKSFATRAPKGYEAQLAEIHTYVYPPQVLQVGDEAVDAELFDMEGNNHRLFDAFSDGRYVLLDFWAIGCYACYLSEPELKAVYEKMKEKLEIVGINQNTPSQWQKHEFSRHIVWKNWNDGKMGSSVNSRYCDIGAMPYYVLISPDKRILWKAMGYIPGWFLGMAESLNGPKQDNSSNLALAVTKVDASANATKVSFRYYTKKESSFSVAKESFLEANGKRYKVTAANGITLDEQTFANVKAHIATEGPLATIYYSDFTLTFEPFDTKPSAFTFKESDNQGAFTIRNISLK